MTGRSPLHLASVSGRVAAAKELILRGADVSARDEQTYMPLHHAAESGHCQIIELLHENGADLEAVLKDRRTPLAVATYKACGLLNGVRSNMHSFRIGTLRSCVISWACCAESQSQNFCISMSPALLRDLLGHLMQTETIGGA